MLWREWTRMGGGARKEWDETEHDIGGAPIPVRHFKTSTYYFLVSVDTGRGGLFKHWIFRGCDVADQEEKEKEEDEEEEK
mmetsp:Transcript_1903/g.3597  ORF Transcript_1903/g.3597 Transcript_1903/m.3597 type:complete len:80 (-) Transcript_1903:177-416(-)